LKFDMLRIIVEYAYYECAYESGRRL